MDFRRVPLRIPPGWFVVYNSLYELDPVVRDGKLVDEGYFWQDMLLLRDVRPTPDSPTLGPYMLDVGWYPDGAAEGRLRMELFFGDRDNLLHCVESRDWRVIRDAIDATLHIVARFRPSPDEVAARLKPADPGGTGGG